MHGPEHWVMSSEGLRATPEQAERLHSFAHDLRNRLSGMKQILQLLTEEPGDADRKELSAFAEQQFFRSLRLVEDLLDDLSVDRAAQSLPTAPLDLTEHVRHAVQLQEHRTGRKQQHVVIKQQAEVKALAEARHLDLILGALISNASKFTPASGTITLRIYRNEGQACIEVADNGVGLDATDIGQLFVRYTMLKSRSTAGEEQGRSNLARAQQWAHAMGGELSAYSAGPDKGCTLTLKLGLA